MHKKIKEIRIKNGYTQQQIAQILGMKYQQYGRYESGERKFPVDILIALADFYGVSLDFLVGRDELRESQDGSGTNAG